MKPTITGQRTVAQSRLFEIEEVDLKFSNNELRSYERLKNRHRGAVIAIPILDVEHILLIKEYAVGIDDYEICFPKGALDADESICDAANRELQEEIGYGAKELQHVHSFCTSPGYNTSRMHIVIAKELYPQQLQGDEPEPLEVIKWRIDEIPKLIQEPRFIGASHLAALAIVFAKF